MQQSERWQSTLIHRKSFGQSNQSASSFGPANVRLTSGFLESLVFEGGVGDFDMEKMRQRRKRNNRARALTGEQIWKSRQDYPGSRREWLFFLKTIELQSFGDGAEFDPIFGPDDLRENVGKLLVEQIE